MVIEILKSTTIQGYCPHCSIPHQCTLLAGELYFVDELEDGYLIHIPPYQSKVKSLIPFKVHND